MIEWRGNGVDPWEGYDLERNGKRVLGVRFDGERWFGTFISTNAADMEILILESCMPARPRFATADEAKRWTEETYTGFRAAATLRSSR